MRGQSRALWALAIVGALSGCGGGSDGVSTDDGGTDDDGWAAWIRDANSATGGATSGTGGYATAAGGYVSGDGTGGQYVDGIGGQHIETGGAPAGGGGSIATGGNETGTGATGGSDHGYMQSYAVCQAQLDECNAHLDVICSALGSVECERRRLSCDDDYDLCFGDWKTACTSGVVNCFADVGTCYDSGLPYGVCDDLLRNCNDMSARCEESLPTYPE